jgi:hypothetical protein
VNSLQILLSKAYDTFIFAISCFLYEALEPAIRTHLTLYMAENQVFSDSDLSDHLQNCAARVFLDSAREPLRLVPERAESLLLAQTRNAAK